MAFLPDRDIGASFANVGWFSSCSSTIYFRIELPRQNKKPCRMTRQGRIILTINKKESLNNLCVLFPLRNQQDSPPLTARVFRFFTVGFRFRSVQLHAKE